MKYVMRADITRWRLWQHNMSDAGYISDSDNDSGIGRPMEPSEQEEDDNFSSESEAEAEDAMNPPPAMQLPPEQVTSSEDQQPSTSSQGNSSSSNQNKNKKKKPKKDSQNSKSEEKKEDENQEAEFPEPIVQESDDNKSKEVDTSDDNALLMMLKMRRNESRKLNHAEVQEEEKRSKLPANWEAKKRRVEWELSDQKAREEAEKGGKDYDIVKNMSAPAQELEYYSRKAKKKNPDPGFSDFAASQFRQYERISGQLRVNEEAYEEQRQKLGDAFYPAAGDILTTGKVSTTAVDKMAADIERQIKKRSKYSRRRTHVDDADISYINERNKKFNEKCERFYGKYTEEIRGNLERGTALWSHFVVIWTPQLCRHSYNWYPRFSVVFRRFPAIGYACWRREMLFVALWGA